MKLKKRFLALFLSLTFIMTSLSYTPVAAADAEALTDILLDELYSSENREEFADLFELLQSVGDPDKLAEAYVKAFEYLGDDQKETLEYFHITVDLFGRLAAKAKEHNISIAQLKIWLGLDGTEVTPEERAEFEVFIDKVSDYVYEKIDDKALIQKGLSRLEDLLKILDKIRDSGKETPAGIFQASTNDKNSKLTLLTPKVILFINTVNSEISDPIDNVDMVVNGLLTLTNYYNDSEYREKVFNYLKEYGLVIIAPKVTMTPSTGTFKNSVSVKLHSDRDATIYYTLDGTVPTQASDIYKNEITLNKTTTIKAFAVAIDYSYSEVEVKTYTLQADDPGNGGNPGGGNGNSNGNGNDNSNGNDNGNGNGNGNGNNDEDIKDDTLPEGLPSFVDLKGYNWASTAIMAMAAKGVIKGVGNNKFAPEKDVTRLQFVIMLSGLLNLEGNVSDLKFNDLKKTDLYAKQVAGLLEKGFITGKTANVFAPNEPITRQEIASILGRVMTYYGYDYMTEAEIDLELGRFADLKKVSAFARPGLALTVKTGIIQGNTDKGVQYLNPTSKANRAQAALMLYRLALLQEIKTVID